MNFEEYDQTIIYDGLYTAAFNPVWCVYETTPLWQKPSRYFLATITRKTEYV